jgi:flagellar M-ring protein FliF
MVNNVPTARTPEELKKMQDLVAAAIGIDAARGDQIVVQTIPFDQPAVEVHTPTWIERYRDLVQMGIKYGALAVAALLLILFVIRPARRALKTAAQQPRLLPAGAAAAVAHDVAGLQAPEPALASSARQDDVVGLPPAPRTVAEIEAEMEAQVEREMASMVPEIKRAGAIKKRLVERSLEDPETIAMTLRGWLQEKK